MASYPYLSIIIAPLWGGMASYAYLVPLANAHCFTGNISPHTPLYDDYAKCLGLGLWYY